MSVHRSVVVHGHFYQPPREDPWTGHVPVEASAAPFHDWNQRIHDECYKPIVGARVLDEDGQVSAVVNTLEWISWNAGPTLLTWLAREAPDTYRGFLEADARCVARLGYGSAMATPYHHVILPLTSPRERTTEIRWGVADFRTRFGREPVGMWLPETAVDTPTLEALAAEGIRFTVLAPGQVEDPPADGLPGRIALPSGREIVAFVYDGALAHQVAFGNLLQDGHAWAHRMAEPPDAERRLVSLATDGETWGHHHRWGDMALAAAIQALQARADVRLETYESFLAANPPHHELTLVEPSAWSCAHGVDRWQSECGCKGAPEEESQQAWRSVLRESLDALAGDVHELYEAEAGELFVDPWKARDGYGRILESDGPRWAHFLDAHAARPLAPEESERARALLEMERDALRMYTSCGWFFDDLDGIEPLQNLRYAAHAMDLAGTAGGAWEARMKDRLSTAKSNGAAPRDGAAIWDTEVRGKPVVDGA